MSRPRPQTARASGCRLWSSSAAVCGNLQLLLQACWDKWHHGNLSRNPRTSSACLSKARLSRDCCWRTQRTCHYPLEKASRYLLGFVHTFSPVRFTFPWDNSGMTVVSCLELEQRTGGGHVQTITATHPCLCPGAFVGDGGGAS